MAAAVEAAMLQWSALGGRIGGGDGVFMLSTSAIHL